MISEIPFSNTFLFLPIHSTQIHSRRIHLSRRHGFVLADFRPPFLRHKIRQKMERRSSDVAQGQRRREGVAYQTVLDAKGNGLFISVSGSAKELMCYDMSHLTFINETVP